MGHRVGAWVAKLPWLRWCRRCGLVALKNAATQKAFAQRCPADDPD